MNPHNSMSERSTSKCFIESLEEIELYFSFKTDSRTFKATTIRLYTRNSSSSLFSLHDKITFSKNFLNMESEKIYIAPFGYGPDSLKTVLLVKLLEEEEFTIGESQFTLYELLKAAKGSIQLNISTDCELFVHWAVPEHAPSLDVQMTVESLGLRTPTSWFSRQDFRPRFQVYRCISETEETLVYTSEISNTKCFNAWNRFSLKVNHLCKGLKQNPIKIKVVSAEKVFGEAMFSLEQVLKSQQHIISLADEGKQKRVGSLRIGCELSSSPTFNDYSRAGLCFNTMLSIGLLESSNEADKAIIDILPFLTQANTSSNLPIYSTGSTVESLKARRILSQCRVSAMIEKAKYLAKFNALYRNQEYVVAVVLTDGDIQDIQEVNRQIKDIESGNLPVSIVFLGIGGDSSDFTKLEKSLSHHKTCFIRYEQGIGSTLLIREVMKETEEHLKSFIEQEKKGGINQYNLFWNTNDDNKISGDLRAKVPPMVKSWICQNDRKEFAKSKEMIDKFLTNLFKDPK